MLNLLRRSKRSKTHKSPSPAPVTDLVPGSRAGAGAGSGQAANSTARLTVTQQKRRTAAIAVIEDLEDSDDVDEGTTDAGSGKSGHSNYFYTERGQNPPAGGAAAKVNLERIPSQQHSAAPPSNPSGWWRAARGGGGSGNDGHQKAVAFSKVNVEKINSLATVAAAADAGSGNVASNVASEQKMAGKKAQQRWAGNEGARLGNDQFAGDNRRTTPKNANVERFETQTNNDNISSSDIKFKIKNSFSGSGESSAVSKRTNSSATHSRSGTASAADTPTTDGEVRYRNPNRNRNKDPIQNRDQSREPSAETKRQSRLSLTLAGLSLSHSGKSKDTKREELNQTQSEREGNDRQKEERRTREHEADAATGRKLRPLQKGRAFLSDIFMARGRNHNRHRSSQQSAATPQPSSPPTKSVSSSASASPSYVFNGRQQQQPQRGGETRAKPSSPSNNGKMGNVQGQAAGQANGHSYDTITTQNRLPSMRPPHTVVGGVHLEKITERPASTYQMTIANNRIVKNDDACSRGQDSLNSLNRATPPLRSSQSSHSSPVPNRYSNSAEHRHFWQVNGIAEGNKRAFSVERNTGGGQIVNVSAAGRARSLPLNPERNLINAVHIERDGLSERFADTKRIEVNRDRVTFNTANQCNRSVTERDGKSKVCRQLNELTECDRDRLLLNSASNNTNNNNSNNSNSDNKNYNNLSNKSLTSGSAMGQTIAKPETPVTSTRSSSPREFRESVVSPEPNSPPKPIVVPTITVLDYGNTVDSTPGNSNNDSPVEKEVFYDFENPTEQPIHGIQISAVTDEEPDQEVNDDEDDDDDDDDDDGIGEAEVEAEDDEVFFRQSHSQSQPAPPGHRWTSPSRLRNSHVRLEDVPEGEEELADRSPDSPERSPLKSSKSTDSNLSTSFPDSGIGDSTGFTAAGAPAVSTSASTTTSRHSRSPLLGSPMTRMPFVRDGYSTDCDETLMQCDDLDYVTEVEVVDVPAGNERLVCIESISLPDVVVESTTASSSGISLAAATADRAATAAAAAAAAAGGSSDAEDGAVGGEQIINIDGATGNSVGNVHFIPIHVEGSSRPSSQPRSSPKRRSVDDTVIGSGGMMKSYNLHQCNTTIEEIVEDTADCVPEFTKTNGYRLDGAAERLKRELSEQKARFNVQLEDAHKNVQSLQVKVAGMQTKIEQLDKELAMKAWNVERLQGELKAAHQDDEYVRRRLKLLEDEKTQLRHKYSENEDELKQRIGQLEQQYRELEEKYKQTHQLATTLQHQLSAAQAEVEEWREEAERIKAELEEQTRILHSALENSEAERKISEDKWQREFEMLRTQNMEREESLMTDCEWQLRRMQRQCKDKLDKSEHERSVACEKATELEQDLERKEQEMEELKVYEAEVRSLRGVISEQQHSIESLMEQIEVLRSELQTANENLQQQIEAVQKIKYQCDNAIYDKEREVVYRIDEVRNEAAIFWENKLYTEMTRLKSELDSVYVDERREALDKLQAEHIEELRALTNRYTANEDELRIELTEMQEQFETRNTEFLELREKSDNALLQTRMHLDRADREYQNAMCREEERREALEEKLRKEFEAEKEEMEEKFRERLDQVKDEFAKEVQSTTQQLSAKHKKDLELQRAKLLAERDEALQDLAERHKKKLTMAEEQMKEIELRHQRDLKDLKAAFAEERTTMDRRDISNANEIEQLHRKCRCLTNLFEEMRMRYERRDPRQEDLREIAELRSKCESQERDLYDLTFQLREMQMKIAEMQPGEDAKGKKVQKPPPKKIPTTCDVIYEENEERESPPPTANDQHSAEDSEEDEEEDAEEQEEEKEERKAPLIEATKKQLKSSKNVDLINEDDSQMISAV